MDMLLPKDTRVVLNHYTVGFDGPLPVSAGDVGVIVSVREKTQSGYDYAVRMDKGGVFMFNRGEVLSVL